ncbi:peptidoglycan DD-metalloendopeptidase family protein [Dokdonia sp.]|uniref:peptidoglycan DD-metalloendopeptidase family protein n=1 Tax=Dokdonia sp. TaxID=2024995 RepID=UPI0032633558
MVLYLLQATILFSVLFAVYKFVLSKLTFHAANRFVLIALIPISLLLPWIATILPLLMSNTVIEIPQAFENIQTAITMTTPLVFTENLEAISRANYILIIGIILYCVGVIICLYRFYNSMRRLYILQKNASQIQQSGVTLVNADVTTIFSYFKWVFIPKGSSCDPLIIEHEKAHIQLKHTVDLIITELYIALFWYNPMVYAYRKSLRSVHEFQADQHVLRNEIKTSHYLKLVIQHLGNNHQNQLYSYFNTPILKKRIDMMTKKTSHSFLKSVYILLLPVCALVLMAYTKQPIENTLIKDIVQIVESTPSTPSFIFPIENSPKNNITSFFGARDRTIKNVKITRSHTGIDIRAVRGTPVVATADGVISIAANKGAWGNLIVITHPDGYETWYAHLKGFAITEKQVVTKGEIIGYVGNTGNSSGPHLHYELKHHKTSINPMDYFE